jgi:hypothetical protein
MGTVCAKNQHKKETKANHAEAWQTNEGESKLRACAEIIHT